MTPLFWLLTLLAAVLAPCSVLLLTRSLPRISVPGVIGELVTFGLLGALLLLGAPLVSLLIVLLAGLVGTAAGLYGVMNRPA